MLPLGQLSMLISSLQFMRVLLPRLPTGSGEGANKLTLITASKNAHKTRAKRAQNAPLINYACSDLWNQYSRHRGAGGRAGVSTSIKKKWLRLTLIVLPGGRQGACQSSTVRQRRDREDGKAEKQPE